MLKVPGPAPAPRTRTWSPQTLVLGAALVRIGALSAGSGANLRAALPPDFGLLPREPPTPRQLKWPRAGPPEGPKRRDRCNDPRPKCARLCRRSLTPALAPASRTSPRKSGSRRSAATATLTDCSHGCCSASWAEVRRGSLRSRVRRMKSPPRSPKRQGQRRTFVFTSPSPMKGNLPFTMPKSTTPMAQTSTSEMRVRCFGRAALCARPP